jgi:lysophospholipase L1-like esterase
MEFDLLSLKDRPHTPARRAACWVASAALLGCGAAQPAPSAEPALSTAGAAPSAAPAADAAPAPAPTAEQAAAAPGRGSSSEAGSGATFTMPSGLVASSTLAGEALPLPAGTTVLHIGDSFAGALGIELDKALKSRGIKGILRYTTSSYIPTWAWDKNLDQYLSDFKPDLVLITLGGNELEIDNPGQRADNIRRLVQRLGDRPCVWIAPPLWKEQHNNLLEVIQQNLGTCRYMDTNVLIRTMPRAGDNIHPHMKARKDWAEIVLRWLSHERDPSGTRPWQLKQP